jgi:hypothetical protein
MAKKADVDVLVFYKESFNYDSDDSDDSDDNDDDYVFEYRGFKMKSSRFINKKFKNDYEKLIHGDHKFKLKDEFGGTYIESIDDKIKFIINKFGYYNDNIEFTIEKYKCLKALEDAMKLCERF